MIHHKTEPDIIEPTKKSTKMGCSEAAAYIAYKTTEIFAIAPPAPLAMCEFAKRWEQNRVLNIFGHAPEISTEVCCKEALSTTFTSSQGLIPIISQMYEIAGNLTPTVIHIAAKALNTEVSSIFGDHSDVMAARTTGFSMLFGSDVQQVMDFALISHAAGLR